MGGGSGEASAGTVPIDTHMGGTRRNALAMFRQADSTVDAASGLLPRETGRTILNAKGGPGPHNVCRLGVRVKR